MTRFRSFVFHQQILFVFATTALVAGCGGEGTSPAPSPSATTAPTVSTTTPSVTPPPVPPTVEPSTTPSTTETTSAPSTKPILTMAEVRDILILRCGYGICHLPNYTPPNFGANEADLHTTLTTWMAAKCENVPLVIPGNASASSIIRLVKHECPELYMPPDTYVGFVDDDLERITAWINAGAPM